MKDASAPVPALPVARPDKKFGTPHSEVLLEYCYTEQAKEDLRAAREQAEKAPLPDFRRVPDVDLDQERLTALWNEVFPGLPYEDGCGPFQWSFPDDPYVSFAACVADSPEELARVVGSIASLVGGAEVVLVCERDGPAGAGQQGQPTVRFQLGPSPLAEDDNAGFKYRLQRAYLDCYRVHTELVGGVNVNVLRGLEDMYAERLRGSVGRFLTMREQAVATRDERREERVRRAVTLDPANPDRVAHMLEMQQRALARLARRELEPLLADRVSWTDRFERLQSIVAGAVDPRLGCLNPDSMRKVVEPEAVALAGGHVRRLAVEFVQEGADLGTVEAALLDFVLGDSDPDYVFAPLLTRHQRLDAVACVLRPLAEGPPMLARFEHWLRQAALEVDAADARD